MPLLCRKSYAKDNFNKKKSIIITILFTIVTISIGSVILAYVINPNGKAIGNVILKNSIEEACNIKIDSNYLDTGFLYPDENEIEFTATKDGVKYYVSGYREEDSLYLNFIKVGELNEY